MIAETDQRFNGLLHKLGSSPSLEVLMQRLPSYVQTATLT